MRYLLLVLALTACGVDDSSQYDSENLFPEPTTNYGETDKYSDETLFPDPTKPEYEYKDTPEYATAATQEELSEYIEDFIYLMNQYGVQPLIPLSDVTFVMESLAHISSKTAGRCIVDDQLIATIRIDTTHWDKYDDWGREILVFHELGHCVLLRDHNNVWTEEIPYRPVSIMNANIIGSPIYRLHYESYREELFSITGDWDIQVAIERPQRNDTIPRKRPGYELKPTEYFIEAQDQGNYSAGSSYQFN